MKVPVGLRTIFAKAGGLRYTCAMPYPALETLLETEDRTTLLEVRRSWRSIFSYVCLTFVAGLVAVYINLNFPDSRPFTGIPLLHYLTPRWLAIIPGFFLLALLRLYHDDLYILGEHKITHFEGRLSLASSMPVVKYAHIRSVTVTQDIWGRIFDFGNVHVSTAASELVEMTLRGIYSPVDLATLIEDLRNHSQEAEGQSNDTESHIEANEE